MPVLCACREAVQATGAVIYKQWTRVHLEQTVRSKAGVFRRTGEEKAARVRSYSADARASLGVRRKGEAVKPSFPRTFFYQLVPSRYGPHCHLLGVDGDFHDTQESHDGKLIMDFDSDLVI